MNTWVAQNNTTIILGLALLSLALIVISTWLAVRVAKMERHYRSLTKGTDGGTLEEVLESHVARVRQATDQVNTLSEAVRGLEEEGQHHLQHFGFVRFNPFREMGGDQSFVLALADGCGNGGIISTLHSRDVTRVYAKPLREWQSTYPFTEEEQQALQQARARTLNFFERGSRVQA